MEQLVDYSDAVWRGKQLGWQVDLADQQIELDADVRRVMDLVMIPMNERFCGRPPDVVALSRLETAEERSDWLDRQVEGGDSLSAYPVTFGTAYELIWSSHEAQQQALSSTAELAYGTKKPFEDGTFLTPAEAGYEHDWFVGENRSVLALVGQREVTPLSTFDSLRTQTLEYLTLQRAALRAVQRGTQVTITERRPITRTQLQQWQRLVASLTDEYVLHDQVAVLVRPLRKHMKENSLVRDPATLEEQVRQNLETFQEVISAASNRVAIILSGLFGVVAALALAPLARNIELTVFRTSGSPSTFDSHHLVLSILLDILLIAVVGSIAGFLISRANKLRWPRR
jgi:hypothetical protein